MTVMTRRGFIGCTAAGAAMAAGLRARPSRAESEAAGLLRFAPPITALERGTRVTKLQSLMQRDKVAALLVEAGPSLEYFTGIRWWRSERTTAALIPASGKATVVTPFFEVPSVEESLQIERSEEHTSELQSPCNLVCR